jgi:hypothetical protein
VSTRRPPLTGNLPLIRELLPRGIGVAEDAAAVGDFAISASVGKDALSNKSSGKPRSLVFTARPTGERLRDDERPREDVSCDEGDRERPRPVELDKRRS